MLVFGAIGAGIGALVDAGVHGYSILDGPPLASPNARRVPAPVTVLDDLWLRVRQGDTIEVAMLSGQKVTCTFVHVSSASVTVTVQGALRDIPSSNVRRVTRAGNRYRTGALWGGRDLRDDGFDRQRQLQRSVRQPVGRRDVYGQFWRVLGRGDRRCNT